MLAPTNSNPFSSFTSFLILVIFDILEDMVLLVFVLVSFLLVLGSPWERGFHDPERKRVPAVESV